MFVSSLRPYLLPSVDPRLTDLALNSCLYLFLVAFLRRLGARFGFTQIVFEPPDFLLARILGVLLIITKA